MIARLGRVIYWTCCGLAALLAIAPLVVHGLPLLEKSPLPLDGFDKAQIALTSSDAKEIKYLITLPTGKTLVVNYEPDGPGATDQRAEYDKRGTFDDLVPEKRLPILEEARRRGELPAGRTQELDEARQQTALAKVKALIEGEIARRNDLLSAFTQIVPWTLAGALLVFLFGRGVRYVLANE